MSENNDKIMEAFKQINEKMDAHLVESIISLFHQGVLKHYVSNPRQVLDEKNFKMTIESANGVKFEGREKLIELEQEVERLREESLKLRRCHNCKFPIFDYGGMDCHKKDKSFYDKYDLLYCDKWEINK